MADANLQRAVANVFLGDVTKAGVVFAQKLRQWHDGMATTAIICNTLMGYVAALAMDAGINRATLDAVTTRAFDNAYLHNQPMGPTQGDA